MGPDPKTITVSADGGKIKLEGTVSIWKAREVAGTAAWSAPGATDVENDIAVAY